jgi:hypothetical protein
MADKMHIIGAQKHIKISRPRDGFVMNVTITGSEKASEFAVVTDPKLFV